MKADWEKFEEEMQEALGLYPAPGSGNQWNHPGDGSTGHPSTVDIAMIIDAKTTKNKSYSLKSEFLDAWKEKADELGQTFLLPVKFKEGRYTWITMEFDDFLALLDLARKGINSVDS